MPRALTWLFTLVLALGCGPRLPTQTVTADVLTDVDAMASAAQRERSVPGLSLTVLHGDDVVLARGYGVTDDERQGAVSEVTIFQLGSISKQFLAALVLRLTEQGRVSLDDPVIRHLPDFTSLTPDVRVRDLLRHTSGIRELFAMPEYLAGIEDLNRSADEIELVVRSAPVDFVPGSRWSYSNANYQILARLVERLTGTPYERVLDEEFFGPLGLASLHHCTPLPSDQGEARGHVLRDGVVVPATPENMHWIRGDGGLCGHALDVARWTRLLASGQVVTPSSYREMSAPARLEDGREVDYGFGLSLVPLEGRRKVAHNGAMLGFSASAAYYPDAELTIVVLANRGDVRTESVERAVARRLLGLPAPDLRELPLDAETRQRVVGRYDIGVFTVHVDERDGRLWLESPPPGPTSALRHLGGGAFACESDPDACRVSFADGDAPAEAMRLFMGAMHWYGVRVP